MRLSSISSREGGLGASGIGGRQSLALQSPRLDQQDDIQLSRMRVLTISVSPSPPTIHPPSIRSHCSFRPQSCAPLTVDYILFLTREVTLELNPNEVSDARYVSEEELKEMFEDESE